MSDFLQINFKRLYYYIYCKPWVLITKFVFKRWGKIYCSLLLYITCIGIGNIVNIAKDNGFFENPLDHSDYGLKYLLGIIVTLTVSFLLMSE